MTFAPAVLAVIFDFDDTLVPDSTTKLLQSRGVDTERFWKQDAQELVGRGYDPPMAYLKLLLEMVRPGGPLEGLTEKDLADFGASLDNEFYPGLPDLFDELRESVGLFRDISIEFYIISGGLETIILGSEIVQRHFDGAYGCRLEEGPGSGGIAFIRRCVTFTEKTRYPFEINKGVGLDESAANPYLVNRDLSYDKRRIPFTNMTYVGDGLTDIPCFSLVKKEGGIAFGVFQPGEESSAKKAFLEFLRPARVVSMHAPRYNPDDELGLLLRAAVKTRCSSIVVERGGA